MTPKDVALVVEDCLANEETQTAVIIANVHEQNRTMKSHLGITIQSEESSSPPAGIGRQHYNTTLSVTRRHGDDCKALATSVR